MRKKKRKRREAMKVGIEQCRSFLSIFLSAFCILPCFFSTHAFLDEDGSEGSDSETSEHLSHSNSNSSNKKKNSAPPVPVPDRTTVLLSCYGVGYSNVFRKAT